jgi:hypothetical protein
VIAVIGKPKIIWPLIQQICAWIKLVGPAADFLFLLRFNMDSSGVTLFVL